MSKWVTAEVAMKRAGRGRTWLDNRAETRQIRKEYERIDNRRRAVYHIDDVDKLIAEEGRGRVDAPPSMYAKRKLVVQVPPVGKTVWVRRSGTDGPSRGRVVERYPRFAVVEFPQGYKESFFYEDLSEGEVVRRAG